MECQYALTDWLMVIITFVYVIATIFICVFNGKSARAAKSQIEEMSRQFYAVNRPLLSVEIVYLRRSFYALRFTNNGNQTAFNTFFDINQDFIDNLSESKFKELLESDKGKIRNIGVGQHYDLFFGTNKYLKQEKKIPIIGRMHYRGVNDSIYAEDFIIEPEKYASFLTVDSDVDDLIKELKNQTDAIKRISKTIENDVYKEEE